MKHFIPKFQINTDDNMYEDPEITEILNSEQMDNMHLMPSEPGCIFDPLCESDPF